jgi:hypothetical protein
MKQKIEDQPVSIPALLKKIDEAAIITGRTTSWLSSKLFGDHKRYPDLLERKCGLTVETYNKAWNMLEKLTESTTPPTP